MLRGWLVVDAGVAEPIIRYAFHNLERKKERMLPAGHIFLQLMLQYLYFLCAAGDGEISSTRNILTFVNDC